jgi:hypothetical protein
MGYGCFVSHGRNLSERKADCYPLTKINKIVLDTGKLPCYIAHITTEQGAAKMTTFYVSPKQACVEHNTEAPVIAIKAFERGYYPIFTRATPEQLNRGKYSEEVLEAAVIGSICGWNVPGARPAAEYAEAAERAEATA